MHRVALFVLLTLAAPLLSGCAAPEPGPGETAGAAWLAVAERWATSELPENHTGPAGELLVSQLGAAVTVDEEALTEATEAVRGPPQAVDEPVLAAADRALVGLAELALHLGWGMLEPREALEAVHAWAPVLEATGRALAGEEEAPGPGAVEGLAAWLHERARDNAEVLAARYEADTTPPALVLTFRGPLPFQFAPVSWVIGVCAAGNWTTSDLQCWKALDVGRAEELPGERITPDRDGTNVTLTLDDPRGEFEAFHVEVHDGFLEAVHRCVLRAEGGFTACVA